MRVDKHPILGDAEERKKISIKVDGRNIEAFEGETIAAALMANNIMTFRHTEKKKEPRGLFCGIGQCTDCIMQVNGLPNVRTCITDVQEGMVVETQEGLGQWGGNNDE